MRQNLRPDWRLVRGLGQLQILNRTSMFLVVFVPILAALWSSVYDYLDWHFTGDSPLLPRSWALLFFSSLATLFARTVFQLRCPEMIRYAGLKDFIRDQKREYSDAPSLSSLNDAISELGTREEAVLLITAEKDSEALIVSQRNDLSDKIATISEEIVAFRRNLERDHFTSDSYSATTRAIYDLNGEATELRRELRALEDRDRGDRGPDFRRKMALIELGARSTYLREARLAPCSMLICGVSYLIAIGLIVEVLLKQSFLVAKSAGL